MTRDSRLPRRQSPGSDAIATRRAWKMLPKSTHHRQSACTGTGCCPGHANGRPSGDRIRRQSRVKIDNQLYHGKCLQRMMPGEKAKVLLPRRKDRGRAWVKLPGRAPERIELAPAFAHGDRAGARGQASREAASHRFVRKLERDPDRTVAPFEIHKHAADKGAAAGVRPQPRVEGKSPMIIRSRLGRLHAGITGHTTAKPGIVVAAGGPAVLGSCDPPPGA